MVSLKSTRNIAAGLLATLAALPGAPARAYTAAGDRLFPANVILDQIAPTDEYYVSGSTLPVSGGQASTVSQTFTKSITPSLSLGVSGAHNWLEQDNGPTQSGWQNLTAVAKFLAVNDFEHEFVLSLALQREFGGTGDAEVGADRRGATQPAVFFGKGLGDLDIGYLRPLAITGNLGYAIADGGRRPDVIQAGVSIQYSIPYLQSKVAALDLPDVLRAMTPMIEFQVNAPTGNTGAPRTAFMAPGINYAGEGWELGVEALVPLNRDSGTGAGFIAQLHLALDYLFPDSIGKPLF